jgi:hypothetical protein
MNPKARRRGGDGSGQVDGATGCTTAGRGVTLVHWYFGRGKGRKGYLNSRGEVAIPPQFDNISDFEDGTAVVSVDGKYGIIDTDGRFLVPPRFTEMFYIGGQLWYAAAEGHYVGLVNSAGEVVIPPKFSFVGGFTDGVAAAMVDEDAWGFIDRKGELLIEPCYSFTRGFAHGLAYFELGKVNGFFDRDFKMRFGPTRRRWFQSDFQEGVMGFWEGGRLGFMDTEGRVVIEPRFVASSGFEGGVAWVRVGRLWGLINKKGEFLAEPKFGDCEFFSEGLAWVRIGRLWGAINKKGEYAFEPKFVSCIYDHGKKGGGRRVTKPSEFNGGLARVAVKRQGELRFGYVDRAGNFRLPPIFTHGEDFRGGVVRVIFPDTKRRHRCRYWMASLISENGEVLYGPHKGEVIT